MKKDRDYMSNINELDKKSLVKELKTSVHELAKYNLVRSVGKENNSSKYKFLKSNIARVNTILSKVINEK